ncbi:MAG TPA: hypothetical protein VGB37_06370 [Candidatus Lokiarchaeia archaeon]
MNRTEKNKAFWNFYEQYKTGKMDLDKISKIKGKDRKIMAGLAHSYYKWGGIVNGEIEERKGLDLCGMCKAFDCFGLGLLDNRRRCPFVNLGEMCNAENSIWNKFKNYYLYNHDLENGKELEKEMLHLVMTVCKTHDVVFPKEEE